VRIMRIEDRLLGVQRARADVSEDNPQSTNRKSPLPGSAPVHAAPPSADVNPTRPVPPGFQLVEALGWAERPQGVPARSGPGGRRLPVGHDT